MKTSLILIAGLPATGKSRFAEYLSDALKLPLICKDSIKEILFDEVGFNSHAEKTKLNHASLRIMFYMAEQLLRQGRSVMLENNFENHAVPELERLIAAHSCEVVTVFFGGDEDAIYRRYVKRNADPTRHRGHVLSTEYPERENIGQIPPPIPLEEFKEDFRRRGMSTFRIAGARIEVDATDFDKVDYGAILSRVRAEIDRR